MFGALRKLFLIPALLLPLIVGGQSDGCIGDTFLQLLRDDDGRDVRVTAITPYPGGFGDLLLGGTVGGHLLLSRISATGATRWRRIIRTGSESTELSTLNSLLVDRRGMIAGVGTTFNNNLQKAFLFRYNPNTDNLLYFRQPEFESGATRILESPAGNYLIAGSKQGELSPVFISAYLVSINPTTGQEVVPGARYDFRGDENFLDLEVQNDGTIFAAGNISTTGGSGDIRASISRFSAEGSPIWTRVGPVGPNVNGRLLAFDVEVIDDKVYVLHWGNIGDITGGLNTTILLSRLNALSGQVDWTQEYDLLEFEGESGIELRQHAGGLLIYGFSLIGKRDPWLVHTNLEGQVQWAYRYELGGNATVYFRANQQLLSDNGSIFALATFAHSGERPREGMVLRLDREGNSENLCLERRELTITRSDLSNGWFPIVLERNDLSTTWASAPSGREPSRLAAFDDCDIPCDGCLRSSFNRQAICSGDSLFLTGAFRSTSGIYLDTLPAPGAECDSLAITELAVSNGPAATYTVFQQCGFATAEVRLEVTEGEPPYRFAWSVPGVSGNPVFLPEGGYQVTISDAINCNSLVLDLTVDLETTDVLDYQIAPPICPGEPTGSIALTPAGRGSLRILPAGGFTPNKIDNLSPGVYFVILRDDEGCEAFRQVTIPVAAPVGIRIVGPAFARLGEQISLVGQSTSNTNFSTFQWSGETAIDCNECPIARLTPTTDTWVYLNASTSAGCQVQDSLLIRVPQNQARLYLPTAFSPNGDGLNEVWQPGLGSDISVINSCRIYDRWGGIVFEYEAQGAWWTGEGRPTGTYVYQLTATQIDGKIVSRSGELMLLR